VYGFIRIRLLGWVTFEIKLLMQMKRTHYTHAHGPMQPYQQPAHGSFGQMPFALGQAMPPPMPQYGGHPQPGQHMPWPHMQQPHFQQFGHQQRYQQRPHRGGYGNHNNTGFRGGRGGYQRHHNPHQQQHRDDALYKHSFVQDPWRHLTANTPAEQPWIMTRLDGSLVDAPLPLSSSAQAPAESHSEIQLPSDDELSHRDSVLQAQCTSSLPAAVVDDSYEQYLVQSNESNQEICVDEAESDSEERQARIRSLLPRSQFSSRIEVPTSDQSAETSNTEIAPRAKMFLPPPTRNDE
jgi:hypothetical protein